MSTEKNKTYLFYTFEFLIVAFSLLFVLKRFSVIHSGDGYNEYYVSMVYIGKYIRAICKNIIQGNFSFPQFDFSIGLGEDIISSLNGYGFGDPFMLISALFPVKYSAYLYTVIYLLKIYISGLGFAFYCNKRNVEGKYILLGEPLYIAGQYALCHGFMYPTTMLSAMVSLPFLCAGIDEEIFRDKKKRKYQHALC